MRSCFLLILIFLTASLASKAQTAPDQIGIAGELIVPIYDDFSYMENIGYGASVKGLLGITPAGQLTLTAGYLYFPGTGFAEVDLKIIPLLAGYRHSFSGFFIEPQIGYNLYRTSSIYFTANHHQLAVAATTGYQYKNLEVGARFQGGFSNYKKTMFAGFHLGYNFDLGKSS